MHCFQFVRGKAYRQFNREIIAGNVQQTGYGKVAAVFNIHCDFKISLAGIRQVQFGDNQRVCKRNFAAC